MKKHLANIITSLRIVGALVLTAFRANTVPFLVVYALSGLTDCIDGFVARRLHIISELGKKLDSVSDLLLYGVMLWKTWPILTDVLPTMALYVIAGLILARLLLYVIYGLLYHKLLSTHALLNKVTSILMFLLPFALMFSTARYYCYFTMTVAGLSIIDEMYHMLKAAGPAKQYANQQ